MAGQKVTKVTQDEINKGLKQGLAHNPQRHYRYKMRMTHG